MKDRLEQRVAEMAELEEKLFADLNKVVGMKLAFQEALEMLDEEGAASAAPSDSAETATLTGADTEVAHGTQDFDPGDPAGEAAR